MSVSMISAIGLALGTVLVLAVVWLAVASPPPRCPLCRHSVHVHSTAGCSGGRWRPCSCAHHALTEEAIEAWFKAAVKAWRR